ncbi:MAG TPA: PPC domain-containing protein, partial [Gemmataceae bacterium]|nr:PPC domain-containing protein [Gemmataceae bacterium]
MRRSRFAGLLFLLTLIAFLSLSRAGWAQKGPAPVQPNPQAPTLALPVPLGIQRGTTLELNLTGTNLADPVGLWTSFPAQVSFPADGNGLGRGLETTPQRGSFPADGNGLGRGLETTPQRGGLGRGLETTPQRGGNNGRDNAKLRVRLEVPADAPLGFHSLRLATVRGISNFRLFCVDDLPQVMETDTNRSKSTPQTLPVPCVVVGRTDPEVSDFYKITVKAGQRLSFEVLGRRLGSPLDPQLTLFDPRSGRELPGGHSNDAPGCQTDPRLTYTFKEDGDVLIELRDVIYRGGADYWYRLRIGDFPCAVAPYPMAARRGSKVAVGFTGPAVEGIMPVEVTVPADPAVDTVWVAPRGPSGLHGWPVALAVSDIDELTEQEPNNEPGQANRIPVPGGISGRFERPNDTDHFVFTAKKGQRLLIDAHTLELYSPTLAYMVLRDAKGAEVARTNPQAAAPLDQRIDYTPPADGDYTLEVQHLNYAGGPNEAYRVTVTPYEPGFSLAVPLDRWDVPAGGT